MARVAPSPILQLIRRIGEDIRVRELSDEDLLGRCVTRQDTAALQTHICRHGAMVLGVCRDVLRQEDDAEDAFQATFLTLARKAGTIRQTASLASWLHGVAYRTALKTRAQLACRRKVEARVARQEQTGVDEPSWSDVRQVLHEELSRLPEHYQAPLVLCYLQGKTQDEAAAQLGLPKGTLKGWLERGRASLRGQPQALPRQDHLATLDPNKVILDPFDRADRLARLPGLLVKESKKSDADLVEALFLATLMRQPVGTEKEHVLKHLKAARDREEACRDILWALVNSKEFIQLHGLGKDIHEVLAFINRIAERWPARK